MVLIHNGPPKHAVSQILETEFHEFELRPKLPNLMDINAFVQILVYTFCSPLPRLLFLVYWFAMHLTMIGISVGVPLQQVVAVIEQRLLRLVETVSVRIVLPIDMKNLEATAHQHAPS